MHLFSEIYNCYYQIMQSILTNQSAFTLTELQTGISEHGYEESLLFLIPKLKNREWDLFEQKDGIYLSRISKDFYVPLTMLQKSYIKTILQDERIRLFFDADELKHLQDIFANISVLWKPDDFYYYDRFSNKDDYANTDYQQHFRTLITAISQKQYVDISYKTKTNQRVHHHYLPCRLEYSIKNDKFRLLGIEQSARKQNRIEILNLDRMKEVTLLPAFEKKLPDINERIRADYYKEPVRLLIHTERNTLERTMLQFANYEKNTRKIDAHTYECLIYYNKRNETELLIEVLSFGPMIEVLGNEPFLQQIKQRLKKQKALHNSFIFGEPENNNM